MLLSAMLTNAAASANLARTNASVMLTKTVATAFPAPALRFSMPAIAAAPAAGHFTKHALASKSAMLTNAAAPAFLARRLDSAVFTRRHSALSPIRDLTLLG
jgi:hypothetical protein